MSSEWPDDRATRRRPVRFGALAIALALIAFVAVGGAGALIVRKSALTYRSTTVLTIDQPAVIAGSRDAGPIMKLSELRLQYSELLTTAVLDDAIATEAGVSAGYVASHVSAAADPSSLLIVVRADSSSSRRAARLATAAADQLVNYAKSSQNVYGIPASQQVVLNVVTPATPGARLTRSLRTVATLGLFLGLVAAGLVLALATLVRRRRT